MKSILDDEVEDDQSQQIQENQQNSSQKKSIKLDFSIYLARAKNKVVPSLLIYQKLNIYDIDYNRLEPEQWLNDKVIDFFVEFLTELKKYRNSSRLNIKNEQSNSKILCSYVFSSLDQYQYNRNIFDLISPQNYLRVENVKSILEYHDRVFLVVNEANYHWILLEISLLANKQRVINKDSQQIANDIQYIQNNQSSNKKNSTSNKNKQKKSKGKQQQFKANQILSQQSQIQLNIPSSTMQGKQNCEEVNENENNMKLSNQDNEQIIRTIQIKVYNSLGQRFNIEDQTAVVLLKKYFMNDFQILYGKESILEFNIVSEKAPTQQGGPDCGVFCCKYLQKLYFEGTNTFEYGQFTQSKMIEYRKLIQQIIMDIKNADNDYNFVYEKYINLNL